MVIQNKVSFLYWNLRRRKDSEAKSLNANTAKFLDFLCC